MITIESLNEEDLPGLKKVYEEGFEMSPRNIDLMLNAFSKIESDKNYNILCAKVNGKVVGSVMGVACMELFGNCQPFMVVENVVVLQDHRRLGIAKMLLIELEARAKKLDCSTMLFVSSEHRKEAHKLYDSLGFGKDPVNGYRKQLK
jgi:ribosomal protein S18 acetylase RimI-like enzyme